MRKAFAFLTVAPALLTFPAIPALAQTAPAPALARLAPDGSANVNLVGKVGLKGSAVDAAVDGVTNPVGGTVDRADSTVGKAVDTANLTLATREQVRAGDTAVVVRGGKLYNVPIAQIYHGAVGAAHGLVTKLSSAEIQARTTAAIESR